MVLKEDRNSLVFGKRPNRLADQPPGYWSQQAERLTRVGIGRFVDQTLTKNLGPQSRLSRESRCLSQWRYSLHESLSFRGGQE